jgi:hypothetical protein
MFHRSKDLIRRPAQGLVSLLCAAALLAACGGGGSSTSADTRSAYAAGPITGFGSIIVNGVRFDDSSASVTDDDGASHRSSELRLGMMAEVTGSGITDDGSGARSKARSIRFGSEIVGPVQSIAADGKSLVVLGQTVQITATTLFDDRLAGGLAGLAAGAVVEVHAQIDATTGAYTATRIEPKANALFFKLRGTVAGIDKTAHTFRIGAGTDVISYDAIAASVPATLDNGMVVRVKLQTTQVGGQWIASKVESGVRKLDDHDEAELKGTITASTFATDKKFSVNGIAVDATNATFPKGTAGIVLGALVEVKGSAVNGVIVATRVQTESEQEHESEGFELHGSISSLNTVAKTFVLRGVTVDYGGAAVEFRKGSAANLVDGRNVEVKGLRSADGTMLTATRISFED